MIFLCRSFSPPEHIMDDLKLYLHDITCIRSLDKIRERYCRQRFDHIQLFPDLIYKLRKDPMHVLKIMHPQLAEDGALTHCVEETEGSSLENEDDDKKVDMDIGDDEELRRGLWDEE